MRGIDTYRGLLERVSRGRRLHTPLKGSKALGFHNLGGGAESLHTHSLDVLELTYKKAFIYIDVKW